MSNQMKALVKEGRRLAVQKIAPPTLEAAGQVIVQVITAGLCRTDLYAASGILKTPDSLVLGHEFAGIVAESSAPEFNPGDRVAINPLLSCGHCAHCLNQAHGACDQAKFIGIDLHGCFAGYIGVPATSIFRIPEALPFLSGAYAEPVAAALAVLKTGIKPDQRGLIFGANRFSQLLKKIMTVYGFNRVDLYDPIKDGYGNRERANLDDSAYDYVIETLIDSKILAEMVRVVRPGGTIVLKSRQHEEVSFKLADMIKKEPVLHVVNYGSFDQAISLLSSGKIAIDDLIDGVYKLEDFRQVFNGAQGNEALKPFFGPLGLTLMCGIFTIHNTSANAAFAAPGALEKAVGKGLAALAHRGPDGQGEWFAADRQVALGHTRLAIVGVQNGAQPIANEDQTIQMIVNGEFYGYEKIRSDLEKKGHVFTTRSDGEIALHLYEEYGTDCLPAFARRICPGNLRSKQAHFVCRSRSLRHQADLLRRAQRHALYRLRSESDFCRRCRARVGPGLIFSECLQSVCFTRPHAFCRGQTIAAGAFFISPGGGDQSA